MIFDLSKGLISGIRDFFSKSEKLTASQSIIDMLQAANGDANFDYKGYMENNNIKGQFDVAYFSDPNTIKDIDNYNAALNRVSNTGLHFTDVLSGIHNIGGKILSGITSGLLNASISIAISAIVGVVIKLVDELAHLHENIIKRGKEAQNAIDEAYGKIEEYQNNIKDITVSIGVDNVEAKDVEKNLDSIAQKYTNLKKGVNEFTNANEKLSTDQYQEYLDLCNKLAKQFPTLVKGYDKQGNAILDLSNNTKDCGNEMMNLFERAQDVASLDINENIGTAFYGWVEELKDLNEQILDAKENIEDLKQQKVDQENNAEDIKNNADYALENGLNLNGLITFDSEDQYKLFTSKVKDQFGIELGQENIAFEQTTLDGKYEVMLNNVDYVFSEEDKEKLKQVYGDLFYEAYQEAQDDFQIKINSEEENLLSLESYVNDINANFQKRLSQKLSVSDTFNGLNESIQSAVLGNISDYTVEYANETYGGIYGLIHKGILAPLQSLGEEAQNEVGKIFTISPDNMSIEQYKEAINSIIADVANGNDELAQQLKDTLGLDDKWQEFSEMRRKILYSFDDLSQEDRTEIYNSNIQDIIKMYDLLTSKEMGYYDTYSKLAREASYVTTLPSEGTLADVLESEKFTTEADKIEKKITAINNAISSIKENDILQGDAKTSFLAEIGEDYAGDLNNVADLQKEGGKYISQWISLLYEQGKAADLSSTAFKALTEYANGFIQTYENMNIDENTVSQMLWSTAPEFYVSNKDEFEEEFSEELQDPEKRKILFSVIANTDRANLSLETLREEYDKTEINYELKVQVDEFNKEMKQIEARISDAQYRAGMASSRRQLDNARGIYSNDERYINEQVQARKDEIDEINKQIQSYINGTNPESVMFKRNEGYTEEQLEEVRIAQRKALQDLKNQKISLNIDIEGLEDEKLLLPMQSVENELSVLQGEASKFQDIMNDSSTPTGIETYSDAIKNADEQLELLYAEETFYQELLNNSTLDKTGEKYIGYNDKLNTIQSTIRELIKSQNEWNKAIANMPIDNAREKLEVLDTKMQQLQADQAQKQASGLSLTAEDFDEQNRILEDEIKAQQDIIETATQNRAEQLHIGEDIFDPLRNIKSQNKNLGPKRPVPDAFDFEGIKNQTTEVTDATKAITEAQTSIIENNSQKAGLGLKYIQNAMQDLENEASKLNDILNDDSHKTTIDDYSNAIKNAQDRLSNLHLQEVEILTQLEDLRSKIEEKESTENGGDGFTESDLYKNDDYVALKNDLVSVQTEMKNAQDQTHEWQKAIDNFNVNSMEEEIERLETDLQVLQRGVDLRSAMGFDKTAEDYRQEDAILEENIKRQTERAGILQEEYIRKLMSGVFKYGSKEETDAWNDITAALDSVNSSKVQLAQNKRAEATLGSDIIQKQLTGVTSAAENTTRAINELVNQGLTGTEEQYQEAMSFLSAQYTLQDKLIADLENQLENRMAELNEKGWNPEDFIKDTIYNEIITQINSAKSAQVELNNTFREYLLMLNGGIELNKLQSDLDKLKEVETQYTDAISLAQSRNQSTPLSLTTGLVENRLNQVENIKGQIGQLEKQLLIPGTTSKQFDEILSKIRTLESELANMTPNIEQGIKEIQNYATAVATSMNSAVSATVSETASDQGMSRETIETLTNQFRELASVTNIDLSSMFYNSAKGIKVNTRALEGLLKIQNQVYGKGMMNVVNKYLNGIRTQINGINLLGQAERNEAKQTLEGYRAKLRGMNKQLAGYNTLMEATEKMTDRFAKWQEAVNSENPGDRYDQFASQAGEYEKMRNEGKVGTDEFKAWTALMNYYGHGSAQAYDYQHDLMMRYLFEGPEGAWTFANDMVSNGHGTRTELGGFIFDTLNLEEIARELDISVELAEMLIGKAKDYGAEIEIVNNEIDGTVLQEEKSVDLIKELETLAKEQVQGADMKWIMESNGNIIGLEDMIKKLQAATEEYHLAPLFDEEEYAIQVKYLQNLKEEMDLLGKDNPILYDKLATELERVAQEYHITLDADYNITEADYNKSLEKREEYLRNMQGYLPDFDRVLDEFGNDLGEGYVTQYRNAIDEIENIARTKGLGDIKLNFDYDSASLDEINQHMLDLEDLDVVIDGEESPALKETLNRLHNMAEIEFKLATIVQTDNTSGGDLTIEKLAQMEDQDAINLIINTGVASTDDAEAILQLARSKAAEIPMTIKIDDAQLEQILGRIGNRVTEESEKAPSYKIPIEMKDGLDELRGQVNEAMNDGLINDISDVFGENIQTVFGNIDMNARETLTWTDETIAKYHDMAEKLGVSVGDASTVLGSWNQFRIQDPTSEDIYPLELSVAYTPLLQTGTGTPQVLDENTISQYIQSIMKKATEVVYDGNGVGHTEINKAFMFDLDKEGMYVGDTFVKGIIAEIDTDLEAGNMADKVSGLMHFSGDFGSIQPIIDQIHKLGEAIGMPKEAIDELIRKYTEFGELTSNVNVSSEWDVTAPLEAGLDRANNKLSTLNERLAEAKTITIDPEVADDVIVIDPDKVDFDAEATADKIKEAVSLAIDIANQRSEDKEAIVDINGDSTKEKEEAQNAKTDIETNMNPTVDLLVDTDQANSTVNRFREEVKNNPFTVILEPMNDLITKIQNMLNSNRLTVNVDPIVSNVQTTVQNALPEVVAPQNYFSNLPIQYFAHGTLGAYANGSDGVKNGQLTHDEDALVNELGNEAIIRDGQLHIIPGGMHVEHLRKGDVILNHKQVKALQETGEAPGHGKIVGGESAFTHGTCLNDDDKLKLALASGTVYDGISAYAGFSSSGHMGVGSWGGGINQANYTGLQERFGMIDDTVDDLDDFDDAINDILDDLNDLDDHIQPSFQTIDLVQRRLQYFSNATKKIADQITEFIDTATKRTLLTQEIDAIQNEIYANSRAASVYWQEALKTGYDFKYYDTDKNQERYIKEQIIQQKQYMVGVDQNSQGYKDMNNNLRQLERALSTVQETPVEYHVRLADYFDLNRLRNGDYNLQEIDTSTSQGQALYDAAQSFMNMSDNATNAASQVQQLANQLRQLYSDMINLPFEDLEKALGKLEMKMQTINSFMSTASMGESSIRLLEKTLTKYFGKNVAQKMFDTTGKSFEVLKRQLQENAEKQQEIADQNMKTYNETLNVYNDLLNREARARSEFSSVKWLVGGMYMDASDRNDYNSGKLLDTSHFNANAELVADYNTKLAQLNATTSSLTEAEEKMQEQLEKTKQSAAEAASAMIDAVQQTFKYIDDHYNSFIGLNQQLAENEQSRRDYMIKYQTGYTGYYDLTPAQEKISESYQKEIERNNTQLGFLMEQISARKIELNDAIKRGVFTYDSKEYREAVTEIEALKNSEMQLKETSLELFKTMLQVPSEVMAEKLEKIERSYRNVNAAMSSGIANTKSTIAQYEKLAEAYSWASDRLYKNDLSSIMKSNRKTYDVQNDLLQRDYSENLEKYYEAAKLEQQAALNFEAVRKKGYGPEYKLAKEEYEAAKDNTAKELANIASVGVNNVVKALENIDNFYNRLVSYQDTLGNGLEAERNLILEIGKADGHENELMSSYGEQVGLVGDKINLLRENVQRLKEQLEYGVSAGFIVEGSEEYQDWIEKIKNGEIAVVNARIEEEKLYKEMLEVPGRVATEKIDAITRSYNALNVALSNNIQNSSSAMELLDRVSRISGYGQIGNAVNYNQDSPDFLFSSGENEMGISSYTEANFPLRQNQMIAQNIRQEQEKIGPMYEKYLKYQAEYNKLLQQRGSEGDLFGDGYIVTDAQLEDAKQLMQDAEKEFEEQQAKAVNTQTEGAKEMIKNIEAYFQVYLNHQEQLRQNLQSIRDYIIETSTYIKDGANVAETYKNQITSYTQDADYLIEQIASMRAQLQEGLESGSISAFDAKQIEDQIAATEIKLRQMAIDQQKSFGEMMNVPAKITEEALKKIEQSFAVINAQIDAGITDSTAKLRAWSNLGIATGTDTSRLFATRESEPEFIAQNQALRSRLDQSRQEMSQRYQEMKALEEIYRSLSANPNVDDGMLKKAREALDTSKEEFLKIQAETASMEIDTAVEAINNIDAYYKSLSEYTATVGNHLEKVRNYIKDTSTYIKSANTYMHSYEDQIQEYNKQYLILEKDAQMVRAQLAQAMREGKITVDDKEYRDAMNKIAAIEDQMVDVRSSQQKLFKELVALPNEVATEKIDDITKSYMQMSAAINAGIADTKAMQRNYTGLMSAFSRNNAYLAPINTVDYSKGLTYEGQNKALLQDLAKEQQTLSVYNQAVYETGKNFERIRRDASSTEGEIKSAEEEYETALQNFADKSAEVAAKEVDTAKKLVSNIGSYYKSIQEYNQNLAESYEKVRDVLEEIGRSMDKNGNLITDAVQVNKSYELQIENMEKAQNALVKSIATQEAQLKELEDTLQQDTEDYREVQNSLIDLRQEYMDLTISIDQAKDAWREQIYFKPIEEAIEKINRLRDAMGDLNGLISDEAKLTEDGEYTQLGLISLTLDTASYTNSLKELEEAQEYYNTVQDRYLKDASYSDEEYLENYQKASEQIISAMQNVNQAREAMLTAEKNRLQTELDYTQKLIQAQKDELAKKKELADYDKTLKKKNNAIMQLENEIAALNGLMDAESKSKKKRLEEQLKEAQEDRQDTVTQHIYDLRNQNLDNLSKHLDDMYKAYVKDLAINISSIVDTVNVTTDNIATYLDQTNAALDTWLNTFQPGLDSSMVLGINKLTEKNTTIFPDRKEMENAAKQMVNYVDNLSPQEYNRIHEEINGVIGGNTKINNAQEVLRVQQENYQSAQKQREDLAIANDLIRNQTIKNTGASINGVMNTNTGKINLNLNAISNDLVGTDESSVTSTITTGFTTLSTNLDEKLTSIANTELSNIDSSIGKNSEDVQAVSRKLGEIDPRTDIQTVGDSVGIIKTATENIENKTGDYTAITSTITSGATNIGNAISNVKDAINKIPDAVSNIKTEISNTASAMVNLKNAVEKSMENYKPQGSTVKEDASIPSEGPSYNVGTQNVNAIKPQLPTQPSVNAGITNKPNTNKTNIIYTQSSGSNSSTNKVSPSGQVWLMNGANNGKGELVTLYTTDASSTKKTVVTAPQNPGKDAEIESLIRTVTALTNDGAKKTYKLSTVQKVLDAIYNRQKLTATSGSLSKSTESNLNIYNEYRSKYTQQQLKTMINRTLNTYKYLTKEKLHTYATGTLSASPGLAQVFEKGPEIITTKKGTFVPFTGGEGVIPADLTKNLVKMALLIKDGGFELKMPDMSNYKIPEPKQNVTNTSEINIGSLITINGNADENTVDQIREIAESLVKNRQFQENVTKFVSARQVADGVMAGKRKAIR